MIDKIGGKEGEEKKPGLLIAIGAMKKPKMPSRIGGTDEEEGEAEGEGMSGKEARTQAARQILSAIEDKSEERLESGLEAFFYALDDEPQEQKESE